VFDFPQLAAAPGLRACTQTVRFNKTAHRPIFIGAIERFISPQQRPATCFDKMQFRGSFSVLVVSLRPGVVMENPPAARIMNRTNKIGGAPGPTWPGSYLFAHFHPARRLSNDPTMKTAQKSQTNFKSDNKNPNRIELICVKSFDRWNCLNRTFGLIEAATNACG
jgi:hypothetical protein